MSRHGGAGWDHGGLGNAPCGGPIDRCAVPGAGPGRGQDLPAVWIKHEMAFAPGPPVAAAMPGDQPLARPCGATVPYPPAVILTNSGLGRGRDGDRALVSGKF